MYHNKNFFTKTIYYLSPTFSLILAVLFVTILSIYIYYRITKQEEIRTMTDKFADYIYEYATSSGGIEDAEVSSIISTFQYDDVMLPTSKSTALGKDVANYNWNTNAEAFMDITKRVQRCVVRTCQKESIHYQNKTVWKIAKHFVKQVQMRLPTKPKDFNMPWGENWYQFSITYPLLLVIMSYMHIRIFGEVDRYLHSVLSLYIQNYFKVPSDATTGIKSIGWTRAGPNAVMMAVPYIGGHLLLKDLDLDNNVCKYLKNYIKFEYVTTGEGLYADNGFIFHTDLRAYGYIYSAYIDIAIVSNFLETTNYVKLRKVFETFEHPTIQRHFSAWFTRTPNLMSTKKGGKLGFYVVDSIAAVIAKTDNWMLAFNGQRKGLCYYEADKDNYSWGQIWIGARVFLDKLSDEKWYRDLVPYYPGVISYDNSVVEIRSTRTTTETFLPSKAITMITSMEDAIGIRNEYAISYGTYPLDVIEMTLITNQGIHSYYVITPEMSIHSDRKLTMSLNLGQYNPGEKQGGAIGEYYSFTNSHTFVYAPSPKNNKPAISTITVKHPDSGIGMTCLQIKPALSSINGERRAAFGYSTLRETSVHTMTIEPTINFIRADGYTLHFDPTNPKYLWLYQGNKVAVTREMSEKNYENSISIPKAIIAQKFGEKFKFVGNAVLFGTDYNVPTDNRFQAVLEDIKMPDNLEITVVPPAAADAVDDKTKKK